MRGPPRLAPNTLEAAVDIQYTRPGRGVGGAHPEDARLVLGALFRGQFRVPVQPSPHDVVVPPGGNALARSAAPHAVVHDAAAVTTSILDNVRWLVGAVAAIAAPDARIILLTAVSRAPLLDSGLPPT